MRGGPRSGKPGRAPSSAGGRANSKKNKAFLARITPKSTKAKGASTKSGKGAGNKSNAAKRAQDKEDERKFLDFASNGVKGRGKNGSKTAKNQGKPGAKGKMGKNGKSSEDNEPEKELSHTKLKRKAHFDMINKRKKDREERRANGGKAFGDDGGFETVPQDNIDTDSDASDMDSDDDIKSNANLSMSSEGEGGDGWETGSDIGDDLPEPTPIEESEEEEDDDDDKMMESSDESDDGADSNSGEVDVQFDEEMEDMGSEGDDEEDEPEAPVKGSKEPELTAEEKEDIRKFNPLKSKVNDTKAKKHSIVEDEVSESDEDEDDFVDEDDDDFISAKDKIEMTKQIQSVNRKGKKSGGFQTMGLSMSMFKAIKHMGYKVPTPIQRKTIPIALEGRDVVAMARTGSGKTAAFIIPMLEKLKVHSAKVGIRGLIITPSRELAQQTYKFVKDLGKYSDLRYCMLVGGDTMESQFAALQQNPDIVIATPGRLMHLIIEMKLDFKTIECVVYDEADRLFELGFAEQLREILYKLPESRQTFLFSATLPKILVDFAKAGLMDPVLVRLDVESKFSDDLQNYFFAIKHEERDASLLYLFKYLIPENDSTIVFVSTKHHVDYVHELLTSNGVNNTYIYGPLDMAARRANLMKFRKGIAKVLVVTDVASRGIDIPLLDNVVNFDFPGASKVFVHRVGRAARAGRSGRAFSLVAPEELPYLIDLQLFSSRPLILANTYQPENWVDANGVENKDLPRPTYTKEFVYGALPPSALGDLFEFISRKVHDDLQLSIFRRNSNNAYKLYTRSRPMASNESYTRAKEFALTYPGIHPIFITGIESFNKDLAKRAKDLKKSQILSSVDEQEQDNDDAEVDALREEEDLKRKRAVQIKREIEQADMLAKLSSFRPTETIFEVQKRRFGKTSMVTGHATSLIHAGNQLLTEQQKEAIEAANIMAKQRSQFARLIEKSTETRRVAMEKIQRQQEKIVGIPSSSNRDDADADEDEFLGVESGNKDQDENGFKILTEEELQSQFSTIITGAKKRTRRSEDGKEVEAKKKAKKVKESYKDSENYMSYRPKDHATESGYDVNGRSNTGANFAMNAASASFEMTGDDNDTLRKGRQGALTWDAKKRKFVRETVGSDNQKKIRTESGNLVNSSFKTERFERWKKQTHTEFQKSGELEKGGAKLGANGKPLKALNYTGRVYRHNKVTAPVVGSKNQQRKQAAEEARKRKMGLLKDVDTKKKSNNNNKSSTAKPVRNEMKSVGEITKARMEKEKRRLKNARTTKRGGSSGGGSRGGRVGYRPKR